MPIKRLGLADQRCGIFPRHRLDADDDPNVALRRELQRSVFQELHGVAVQVAMGTASGPSELNSSESEAMRNSI
jgi:hypothetical protein